MAKRKRWAIAFVVLSIGIFGYKQFEVALASSQNPQVVSINHQDSNQIKDIEKTNSSNDTVAVTLEHFIEDVIKSQKDKEVAVDDYTLLATDSLLKREEFINSKSVVLDTSGKIKKAKKMQKLASYISDTYNVPLIKAEHIVYSTFIEADKKDLEPTLILSLISVESTFQQYSKSPVGALGLTQVMAKVHKDKIAKQKVDILSVQGNIQIGTDILKEYYYLADGNMQKALQMYNGSRKDKTYKYSNKVMAKMQNFIIASK